MRRLIAGLALVLAVAACQVNPVTGERHFQVYGSDWETEVGATMFQPLKQSQGGEFILDPSLSDYVSEVGQRLARQARRKDELDFEFSVLNSSVPNAWALPGGKIVINRGLLTQLDSEAELAAVLGHEIVHADAAHGARQQSKGMLAQIGAVASMIVLGGTLDNPSARELAMLVPVTGLQLIMQKNGRDAERESDEYGMRYMTEAGYDPQGAVELQETFLELAGDRRQDWLSGLFASHPPSRERLENNRETAAELPAGGERGGERFHRNTAYLRRVQPAYDAYDEAGKLAADEQLSEAAEKLESALAIEPREALFHGLAGDLHALADRDQEALAAYRRTIELNPGLFYGYLRAGQIEFRNGQHDQANANLRTSLDLLPTAEAHYLLGRLAMEDGDADSAVEHYRAAAQSNSDAGKKAQRELARLQLEQDPSGAVSAQALFDSRGQAWVELGNRTGVPLTDIRIDYTWLDDAGRTRRDSRTFPGPLAGGARQRFELGLSFDDPASAGQRIRLQVTQAQLAD
ncbi:M48 family metalloprotease [Elongatibacter sediminis]|uniref:M48 family metalloprotease n=1 Tax=Elongatibacter sediminis TaxID=3119006 RepID=A0AAW9R9D5_9GAMM